MRYFIGPLAIFTLRLSCTAATSEDAGLNLAGPLPYGWETFAMEGHEIEANISVDLGYMYESETVSQRRDIYLSGRNGGDVNDGRKTIHSIITEITPESRYEIKETLRNLYINCFDKLQSIEGGKSGNFDGRPVQLYADSIINDIFEVEDQSVSRRGLEKEGILIFSAWMRVYHHLHAFKQKCFTAEGEDHYYHNQFDVESDQAAIFWIGRLQVYGDNTSGMMLYNLAERAAINFNQNNEEADVNKNFISILKEIRSSHQDCTELGNGYDKLYVLLEKMVGVMYTPLIQNLIHYIATDANPALIELYLLALLPQVKSCDPHYFKILYSRIEFLVSSDYSVDQIVDVIGELQSMYNCFSVTCDDIGFHATGIGCVDEDHYPQIPFTDDIASSDVRKFLYADRDIVQINLLLDEKNIESAKELYVKGKNMKTGNPSDSNGGSYFHSLKEMALYTDLKDDLVRENINHRLYKMFENFYDSPEFAHIITEKAFEDDDLAFDAVPVLLDAMVIPQYAMRSFFAAVDVCNNGDKDKAMNFWDQGASVLVGSIELRNYIDGTSEGIGWWGMGRRNCADLDCSDTAETPYLKEMQKSIELGRFYIDRLDCVLLKKNVQTMESIVITPIIQGVLFSSAKRQINGDETYYGAAYAYGEAILPLISVVKGNMEVELFRKSLETKGPYNAENLWITILLSLEDLGIDCEDLGKDTLNILGGKSFCDYVSTVTDFPTNAPQPGQPLRPTTAPTFSPTMGIDSSEINSDLIDGYTFVNKTQAEEKAMIALDLRDILALRSHVESEQAQAKIIYNDGYHTSSSLRMMAIGMEERMANDPYYNLYRNAFRTDPLFQAQGEQGDGYTLADIYADKITTDALEVDIELAYETLVCVTIWMEIAHYLNAAVTSCGEESIQEPFQAEMHIDSALAYYVGVKQTKGNSDGFLLYSLAQKSAVVFDTIDGDSGEALANMKMLQYFKAAKAKAGECNGGPEVTSELRILIGSMMSQLNIPLVQNFAHQLQIGSETEQGSAFSILYGLVVLPQVKTCNPAEYFYLTNEITANGLSLAHINDLISSFKNVYSCFGITCADVHGIDSSSCNTDTLQEAFAGFNPENDVLPAAVVDQDVLKISAYLDENAIIAAHACYEFGHLLHSADIGPIKSLKSIAQDPTWKQNKFFEMMKEYFGNENFADNIIETELSSLANAAEAQEALDSNKISVVMRSLQTLVLFPAGLGRMYEAKEICDDKPLALKYWDEGAAYLIGSVEGPTWGGDEMYKGVGMYGLAKELCKYFKTCTASGNAETNDRLIGYFKSGEDLISGNSCNSLDDFLEKKVMSILMATLIQGAIHSTEGLFARGDATVFADALMPLIDVVGDSDAAANAQIIEDNLRSVNSGDSTQVIEAFSHLLSLTTVKCVDVGVFGDDELTVCKNANDPDQSTDLSDGLYITRTSVKDRAMIGLDVRDMVEKLNGGLIDSAEILYKEGSNSRITDKNGKLLGYRSIASLSKDAIDIMKDEPVYNLYQYTLDDVMNDSVKAYGHSAVQELFDEADKAGIPPRSLPAEAAVALIIWGYITHELYEMILRCKIYSSTSDEDGVHSIDEAVAYWIGEGQETGSKTNGYLLYRLSEEGGELFDQKLLGGQSRTNKNILKLFKETSLQLAFDGTCGQNDSILRTLTMLTNKIIAQMTVPLIQHLIYNLMRNDGPRVALYAKAVVPLLAPCNPETFQFLNEKLLTTKYGINEIDDIIAYLQSSYSCLGLKCDDIGVLQDYSAPQCEDRKIIVPVGNYKPSTAVREYADIDHDIRFIEIMMMNENSAKAALDVYKFGKHSIVMESNERFTLSLRDLVLSSRKIVPTENAVALQNTDDWVQSLLKSPDLGASFDQNRALVASALKYEVLFFAALERLYDAADGCNSQDANRLYRARKDWDIAAAMIIGPSSETNPDGNLMYELAALHCDTFNVCNSKQESKINVELEELLFGGSYLLKGKGLSCAGVQSYANQISGLLKASLIQATLYYAIQNRKLQPNTDNPSLAVGHAISRAILPFVDEVDEAAAVIIKENLAFELTTKPVKDGPDAVFDAFRNTIVKMGVDCKWVGYLDSGKNVCPPEEEESSSSSRTRLHSFSYVVIVIFTIWWSF